MKKVELIKRSLFILIIFLWFCDFIYAYDDSYFQYLLDLNEKVTNLSEFKDSSETIKLKLRQLDNINYYRSRYGVQQVKLDILASRVANMHAYNAVTHDYKGHWDLNGYKPYLRYGLNSGVDHVSENVHASWGSFSTRGYKPKDFKNDSLRKIKEMSIKAMKEGLIGFMAEGQGGGHHDNVVDKYHNYVGLGLHYTTIVGDNSVEYRIVYCEEYIDRYIAFDDLKKTLKINEELIISGRIISEDMGTYAVIVYYEPFPEEMTPSQINLKGPYNDYTPHKHLDIWPWELNFDKEKRRFAFKFKGNRKGFYYVQIYLKRGIESIPYDGGSASTEGLVNASGLIITVK